MFLGQPASVTVLPGQTASLSVVATGTAPLTFQWYVGASGGPSTLIYGATAHVYTAPAASAPTHYWVRVSNPVSGHVLEGGLAGSVTPLVALETGSTAPTLVITVRNGSFWVQMRARAGTNLSTASAQIPHASRPAVRRPHRRTCWDSPTGRRRGVSSPTPSMTITLP